MLKRIELKEPEATARELATAREALGAVRGDLEIVYKKIGALRRLSQERNPRELWQKESGGAMRFFQINDENREWAKSIGLTPARRELATLRKALGTLSDPEAATRRLAEMTATRIELEEKMAAAIRERKEIQEKVSTARIELEEKMAVVRGELEKLNTERALLEETIVRKNALEKVILLRIKEIRELKELGLETRAEEEVLIAQRAIKVAREELEEVREKIGVAREELREPRDLDTIRALLEEGGVLGRPEEELRAVKRALGAARGKLGAARRELEELEEIGFHLRGRLSKDRDNLGAERVLLGGARGELEVLREALGAERALKKLGAHKAPEQNHLEQIDSSKVNTMKPVGASIPDSSAKAAGAAIDFQNLSPAGLAQNANALSSAGQAIELKEEDNLAATLPAKRKKVTSSSKEDPELSQASLGGGQDWQKKVGTENISVGSQAPSMGALRK